MIWNFRKEPPRKLRLWTKEAAKYYKEHPEEDPYNFMDFIATLEPEMWEKSDEEILEYYSKWILENCDPTQYDYDD